MAFEQVEGCDGDLVFDDTLRGEPSVRKSSPLRNLKRAVVKQGIKLVCGPQSGINPNVAAEIALLPSAARMLFLHILELAGARPFVTRSGYGHDFVCFVGDLANFPFYYRRAYARELRLCREWLRPIQRPVIYDIGANTGFFAGHLAQMLAPLRPLIFAFEPVPTTFAKLAQSVERLALERQVVPVNAAVIERTGKATLIFSNRNSLQSQVSRERTNPRVGTALAEADAISLDDFRRGSRALPDLVKIDVEGSEVAVLRGARELLARADRPAILFEYNPTTLAECGVSAHELATLLAGYSLYYVDDLQGQLLPFATPVHRCDRLGWICNLFAVPTEEEPAQRWQALVEHSKTKWRAR